MIQLALRYDPLLYALVGFAAYHCTIEKPDGKLGDFLGYYQKSVTLLRQTFRNRPSIATVLTILQLATIEVSIPRPTWTETSTDTRDRSISVTGSI